MGAWGEKAFQNDSALDWLAEFESRGAAHLRETLAAVADTHPSLLVDVDDGSSAVAAAELVAAALGRGTDRIPKTARAWLDTHPGALVPGDLGLAQRALQRVLAAESELRALWDEHGSESPWLADVRELLVRLGGNAEPSDPGQTAVRPESAASMHPESAASPAAVGGRDKQVLITFLNARGLQPTAEQLARIHWSRDPEQIRRWLARAIDASSVAAVLDD